MNGDGAGGGGVWSEVRSGCEWRMSECRFLSCVAPHGPGASGRGGGVFVVLDVEDANFVISTPTFEENNASMGRALFLISPSLAASVIPQRFPFLPTSGDVSRWIDLLGGFNRDDESVAIPLVLFVHSLGSTVWVDEMRVDGM